MELELNKFDGIKAVSAIVGQIDGMFCKLQGRNLRPAHRERRDERGTDLLDISSRG
jgi:hypothetical protein